MVDYTVAPSMTARNCLLKREQRDGKEFSTMKIDGDAFRNGTKSLLTITLPKNRDRKVGKIRRKLK